MTVYLNKPAVISALGRGLMAHIEGILSPEPTLTPRSDLVHGNTLFFGEVCGSLREFAEHISSQHRSRNNQLLWDALAQIEPQIELLKQKFSADRIAVIMGTSVSGADENLPLFQQLANHQCIENTKFLQQTQLHSDPADFVKQAYDLQGVAYGVSTACTSGARALMSAARLLRLGLCDAVICGGVDTLSPLTINGFYALEVLSGSHANPFSRHRDGINIGEAAAVFIATREPLEGESLPLLGYGASSDAYHMSSPHPDGVGAAAAFQAALNFDKLSYESIGWINLHGTGTVHNDRMESRAVAQIFGSQTPSTSTKPLTGHTLGAAGALEAALLWGVVSRECNPSGKLPPQVWDGERDEQLPEIYLTDTNSYWKNQRIGASASFAFGGNNAVLIIGESDAGLG